MSDKKISELSNNQPLTGSELVPIVQSGATVKTTLDDISSYTGSGPVTGDFVESQDIDNIVQLDQITYDGLGSYDSRTLYVIVG